MLIFPTNKQSFIQRLFPLELRCALLGFACPLLKLLSDFFALDCVSGAAKANPVNELSEKIEGFETGDLDLDFGRFGVLGALLIDGVFGFVDGVFGLGVLGITPGVFGLEAVFGFEVGIRGLKLSKHM